MIKKYWIYGLFVFAVTLFIITRFTKKAKRPDQIELSVKTFQTGIGWGYDIYTNDSLYIHQEYIPAIEGRKGFVTEADAKKIGDLAMEKMKHHKLATIFVSELDSCKISR